MSKNNKDMRRWVHNDLRYKGTHTAILYLSKDHPEDYGTMIYGDEEKLIQGKYNRLAVWPASCMHCPSPIPGFGITPEKSRLVEVVFMKVGQ